jgi:hypothetical protein
MSKHFKPEEILGYTEIDGRKVTVLKMGVTRKHFYDWIDPTSLEAHMNQELINIQRWTEYYKKVVGEDDYANE